MIFQESPPLQLSGNNATKTHKLKIIRLSQGFKKYIGQWHAYCNDNVQPIDRDFYEQKNCITNI
jgi:hypothetical protein